MSSTTTDRQRLFFALWPNPVLQEEIWCSTRLPIDPNAQRVPACNLHITLAFLGATSVEQRNCHARAAAGIQAPAFTLRLDRIGLWPPHILWLGLSQVPEALMGLVQDLDAALGKCGFTPEPRAYQPHMTLARKVNRPAPERPIVPIEWPVTSFALVNSVTAAEGPRYQVLERWVLHAASRDAQSGLCPDHGSVE